MRQLKVSLEDDDIGRLERDAGIAGHSVSEEIRRRLQATFQTSMTGPTGDLVAAIIRMTALVERQTGRPWYSHPAASRVFQDAITARLERLRGGVNDAEFKPGETPERKKLVGSADQKMWGSVLEAIEALLHPIDEHDDDAPRLIDDLDDLAPPV